LKGGDAEENAAAIHAMLAGIRGPLRDAVLLAAAAALVVADRASDLRSGVVTAADSIDSGKARAALEKLVVITHETAP
jgi:anthranilate phosphoribosyltransferase